MSQITGPAKHCSTMVLCYLCYLDALHAMHCTIVLRSNDFMFLASIVADTLIDLLLITRL